MRVETAFSEDEYSIWRGTAGQIIHIPYEYKYVLPIERFWNADFVHSSFNKYWSTSIYIAIIYVILIHGLQRLLRSRKALSLRIPLCLWNATLAVFSIIGTIRFGEEFIFTLTDRPFVHSICYSINPTGPAAFWAGAFAFSKVAELVDTFFIVLRKKPLIFLHWYHHAVVLVYIWNAACELTAAGRWFIFMNYFVHSIMYSYYAVTAYGIRVPKPLSMVITALQTSQMLTGLALAIVVFHLKMNNNKPCQQSMDNLALCFAIYASFAVLFIKFFYAAYVGPRAQKITESKKKL